MLSEERSERHSSDHLKESAVKTDTTDQCPARPTFQGNFGEKPERRGGACLGFPEHFNAIMS